MSSNINFRDKMSPVESQISKLFSREGTLISDQKDTNHNCKKMQEFQPNFSELRGIKFEINVTGDPNEMWLIWKTWFLDVLKKHAPVSDITIKGTSLSYCDGYKTNDTAALLFEKNGK